MKKSKGIISKIETLGTLDGPGIRIVIFLAGCPLRCLFCHNPETWELKGKKMTSKEVVQIVLKYKNYIEKGGVTISGGEPLFQYNFLKELLKELKKQHIHIALDTSGVGDYQEILELVDLVILDIKDCRKEEYKKITLHSIDQFNDFLKACQKEKKELWLRQVIVPGINDNKEYIKELREFIKPIKNVTKIELLPYHNMAIDKYQSLGLKYRLKETPNMDIKKISELETVLNCKDLITK